MGRIFQICQLPVFMNLRVLNNLKCCPEVTGNFSCISLHLPSWGLSLIPLSPLRSPCLPLSVFPYLSLSLSLISLSPLNSGRVHLPRLHLLHLGHTTSFAFPLSLSYHRPSCLTFPHVPFHPASSTEICIQLVFINSGSSNVTEDIYILQEWASVLLAPAAAGFWAVRKGGECNWTCACIAWEETLVGGTSCYHQPWFTV